MIRVVLPFHLRTLASIEGELRLEVQPPVTVPAVLDEIEAQFPMLCGTIRDHVTHERRPFIRFFACRQDLSHNSPDALLPETVLNGEEPLMIVGAMAGG